jgi:acetyl-CoA synthetase
MLADDPGAPLARLFNPRHIAVAGGEVAAEVIRQCRRIGYTGEIWPVNPRRAQIEGLPSFASVADLPTAPDACFVAVPREQTIEVVRALAARGAGGAVCYASGFAEIGGEGVALQEQLVAAAGSMPLLGPNCYGAINYLDGCALWPDLLGGERVTRGVAIITQSGNVALNLTMQRHHLPIAYMVAIGNKAVTDIDDCISSLAADARVTAIGLYLEGLTDVAGFARAAQAALSEGIPIVVLKVGRSDIGVALAASHTRSLAGSDVLYSALFERLGIARACDLDEFLETLKLLHVCGALSGARVASLSCSGGDALMVADLGAAAGLEFPILEAPVVAALLETLGPRVPIHNPLDYQTYIWGDEAALTRCFGAMLAADVDLCLLVLDFPLTESAAIPGWDEVVNAFIAAHEQASTPAALVSSMAELMPAAAARRLMAAGIAPLQGIRSATAAIAYAARIGAKRLRRDAPIADQHALVDGPVRLLDECSAKAALAAFGLATPARRIVASADEAVAAALAIGFPVVVKAVSPGLAHKTEQAAVILNLADAGAVREAAAALGGRFEQVLVEKMVVAGIAELIVGVTRDPQFGLSLTIGAGGILVELLADSVTLLLPASSADIETALRSLRCCALLEGYRGQPRADLHEVVAAIAAVAAFALANRDRLIELDVNPLIATAREAVAVDALIRLIGGPVEERG